MNTQISTAIALLLLVSPVAAQAQSQGLQRTVARVSQSTTSNSSAQEKQAWAAGLAQAREDVSDSRRLLLFGLGLFGGSLLVARWNLELGTTAFLAGGGLAAYGGVRMIGAQSRVRDIEAEGRSRGFTLLIAPDRVGAQYSLGF